ncbi:hypothetical protein Avbf_04130 [Armadillidium vulgare]|nr:hypothetical protein Avbf_04130 [Armadillidium vulgare]
MISKKLLILFLFLHFVGIKSAFGWVEPNDTRTDQSIYDIGVGIYDVTGPAYGIDMLMEKLKINYGDLYTDENVILSGTHTHSGPAGYQQYFIFSIMSLGFIKETFNAMLEGIYMVKSYFLLRF